jgi:hypothetical protein
LKKFLLSEFELPEKHVVVLEALFQPCVGDARIEDYKIN